MGLNILLTAFSAILVENTVFYRALGTSTLIVVAKKRKNLFGFCAGVTYFTAMVSVFTYFADKIFKTNEVSYIYMPLVYTSILGAVYIITLLCMWRFFPALFGKMRKYIHISVYNCAVLGSMFLISKYCETLKDYFLRGLGIGLGFVLAVCAAAAVYDRIYSDKVPFAFRGYPLLMIYLGILSMAFWGLTGHSINI